MAPGLVNYQSTLSSMLPSIYIYSHPLTQIHPCTHPPMNSSVCLSVYLPIYLIINLSYNRTLYLTTNPFIHPDNHPSFQQFNYPSIYGKQILITTMMECYIWKLLLLAHFNTLSSNTVILTWDHSPSHIYQGYALQWVQVCGKINGFVVLLLFQLP